MRSTLFVFAGALVLPATAAAQAPPPQPAPTQAPTQAPPPQGAPPPATTQPPSPYPPQPYPYPPQQYPAGTYPPPAYPPPAYPPPPGYPAYPPAQPQYQAPYELKYKEGQPIPAGYRLKEEPRYGLALGGWLTLSIPYGIGLIAASASDFDNESGWLILPALGPWFMMGRRDYGDCDNSSSNDGLQCLADVFVVMGLLVDGIVQAGGTTMLILGYTLEKKTLVRSDMSWTVRPRSIGSGYGLAAAGVF
jgi:hypothetical protein